MMSNNNSSLWAATGQGMFDGMLGGGRNPAFPTPDAMAGAMANAQVERKVIYKGTHVGTYDLGDEKEAAEYTKTLDTIMNGLTVQTHMLMGRDKKFVESSKPRWIAHLEWMEFELKETPVPPVAGHNDIPAMPQTMEGVVADGLGHSEIGVDF